MKVWVGIHRMAFGEAAPIDVATAFDFVRQTSGWFYRPLSSKNGATKPFYWTASAHVYPANWNQSEVNATSEQYGMRVYELEFTDDEYDSFLAFMDSRSFDLPSTVQRG